MIATGAAAGFLLCVFGLPRIIWMLPKDRGRAFAVESEKSVGKPLGAGIYLVAVFVLVSLVFIPWRADILFILPIILAASVVGIVDDWTGGLSEYLLAFFDLVVALLCSWILIGLDGSVDLWLPFVRGSFTLSLPVALPIFTGIVWLSINATNCSDGVDGLSGSLSVVSLIFLAFLLYGVVGDEVTATQLLIPYDASAGLWAHPAFIMVGCIAGYLWYNAPPSQMLMGDAGSRPIGLLVGILVCASHNVALIVVVGFVVLANGATGLFKVSLKRFFKILVFGQVRFPLHDHFRKEVGWTGTQVLFRFIIIHLIISAILYSLLLKVR